MGLTNFPHGITSFGVPVFGQGSVFGRTWFINVTNGSDDASGKGSEEPFLTLKKAVVEADNYDTILVAQGIMNESDFPVTITQTGLKIFGSGSSGYNWGPCALKSSASGETLMEIDANGVEIAGLSFNCYTDAKSGIVVGASKIVYKTHIHDCFFGCGDAENAEGEVGIAIGCDADGTAGSYDAVDTHVERCGFHYLATAAIATYGTRTKINDCMIWSNSSGIIVLNETYDRAQTFIVNNYLLARGSTGTGIFIPSTAPANGTLLVANNVVANFATDNITQDKSNVGVVNNGTSGNGTSPLIVDSQST